MSRQSCGRRIGVAGAVVAMLVACSGAHTDADVFDLQAHRGGRGETTEESLRAFAKAIELGVRTLELDVVISGDGRPMVWHDPVIEAAKCADTEPVHPGDAQYPYVGKLVKDLTYEQLRTLDCGKLLPEFPDAEVIKGNKIATLSEVFELAQAYRADVRFNIETKVEAAEPENSAAPKVFVDTILDAVRRAGKMGKIQIQSFDWRTLPMVHRAEPDVPLVALWDETTWYPGSPWLGGVDPSVVEDPIEGARSVGANVLSPGYTIPYGGKVGDPGFALYADAAFIDRAHDLGLTVVPWTINDEGTMRAQIDAGADGIITDYPSVLRNVMADAGKVLPPSYHR